MPQLIMFVIRMCFLHENRCLPLVSAVFNELNIMYGNPLQQIVTYRRLMMFNICVKCDEDISRDM